MAAGQFSVGHPVDVATGTVLLHHREVFITGRLPLVWERRYSTPCPESPTSPLGPGWTTRYFATLTRAQGEFHFRTAEGGLEIFADPDDLIARGETVRNLGSYQELVKRHDHYIVTQWDVETGEIERFLFTGGRSGETWPLISLQDARGRALDMLHDGKGRLVGIRQRLEKRTLHINYGLTNRIESVAISAPAADIQTVVRYEYDPAGRLSAAEDALGFANRYEYDAGSRITREIVKDGGVFSFKYDKKGRCIKTSGLDRYDEKSLRYFDTVGWTEVANSLGQVTRYQWNPRGQVTKTVDPLGLESSTEFDDHGRVIAQMGADGAATRYEYEDQGNRCKITNALGIGFSATYNGAHLPLILTNAAGGVWTIEYDSANRFTAKVDPQGGRWAYEYDNNGNLVQITNPAGARRSQVFSPNGMLLEVIDYEGNRSRYVRDPFGRRVEHIDPSGSRTLTDYDALGRVRDIEFANGYKKSYEYDPGNNMTAISDSNGVTTRSRYGSCKRLLQKVNPLGGVVHYRWGSEPGQLDTIKNEKGEIHTYAYDEAGRVVRETTFDGRTLAYKYDVASGQVAFTNGAGEQVTFAWNALGMLTAKYLPDGSATTFEYDVLGNLTSATNPECALHFERDSVGNVVRESQGEFVIDRKYDAFYRVVKTTSSLGHQASYSYGLNGYLEQLTVGGQRTIKFFRNAHGMDTLRLLPGSISLEQQLAESGSLVGQLVSWGGSGEGKAFQPARGNAIVRRRYAYLTDGALESVLDEQNGTIQYGYDAADRLLQVTHAGGLAEQFSYDEAGNLIALQEGERAEVLCYGPGNRLVQQGDTRYEYDPNGRLTKKVDNASGSAPQTWKLTWDAEDHLRSVTTPAGIVWRYTYDPFGRRIAKQSEAKVIRFIWDGDMILHEMEEGSPFSTWLFDPHSFQALCKVQGREFYSVISNRLGTPQELVSTSGRIVWSGRYKAWGGREKHQDGDVSCPVRFPGQWYDEETGFHYNRARYYDPRNGRFISPDPIGVLVGLNLYAYAPNPINCIDPLGLCNGYSDKKLSDPELKDMIAKLRAGQDVTVENATQARQLLAAMPDLSPHTQAGLPPIMPGSANPRDQPRGESNPLGGGPSNPFWKQPPNTYRGDLLGTHPEDPNGVPQYNQGPVHPTVDNEDHSDNPHYNVVFSNGGNGAKPTKAAIIINPQQP